MAEKSASTLALIILINLLFFSMSSARTPLSKATCPMNALKFGICGDMLSGFLGITIGPSPEEPCCSLIQGLVDLEAAMCLCTAIRADVMGINFNIPLYLSWILNACGSSVPDEFQCP